MEKSLHAGEEVRRSQRALRSLSLSRFLALSLTGEPVASPSLKLPSPAPSAQVVGMLGFSQGGALASLLAALADHNMHASASGMDAGARHSGASSSVLFAPSHTKRIPPRLSSLLTRVSRRLDLLSRLRRLFSNLKFLVVAGAPMNYFPPDAPFCSPQGQLAPPR